MKKLVQINIVCNGSTGRIMCDIAKNAEQEGYESFCFYGRGNPNNSIKCIKIGNKFTTYFHVFLTRLFNKHGHGSYFATKRLVRQLRTINPDIIHLHNIHGYYLNLKVLFKYLKQYDKKIIWTLHDCWAFTGHCSYFTMNNCNKWIDGCSKCPQVNYYPKSWFIDTSKKEYLLKKQLFEGLNDVTLVTPSVWLADLVKTSYLNKYNVEVVNNGIDLNIFRPMNDSSIKEKYNIPDNKKIILGVSNIWEKRKGLDIFFELSKIVDSNIVIILVGLSSKQMKNLPSNMIGIQRTDNVLELVKIYSIADVFLNPSLEETFSLVTIEAMACGTPAVVCNTSAVKELIIENTGYVVDIHSVDNYKEKCYALLDQDKSFYLPYLIEHVKKYTIGKNLSNYLKLYK